MSTASPSVPSTTAATAAAAAAAASPYGGTPMHAAAQAPQASQPQAQPGASHAGSPTMHGHTSAALGGSDPHVGGHASSAGLYQQQQESVSQNPHHMAGSFPGAQLSPMASPYATAYGAAQHPMYGASYSGHAYAPYPNYFNHVSHYGAHPPHYPAAASSNPAYHAPIMSGMMPHGGYNPHAAAHMPLHHAQTAAMPIPMAGSSTSTASPAGPGGMTGAMMPTSSYGQTPQYNAPIPWTGRHRVTTTLWEDEGTLCFQVDVKGVCVARRHDNNMVNGTKLLNVCGMSRGKRDGILKNEKERIVVKVGAMHLKGVWIAFNRGKQLAEQHGIADILYPLFEPNIQSFLYHPDNYPRTAAVMAAAQERQAHRHYAGMTTGATGTPVKDVSNGDISAASLPLHSSLSHSHWGSPSQPTAAHDTSTTSSAADTSTLSSYPYSQQHSHAAYHHPASTSATTAIPSQATPSQQHPHATGTATSATQAAHMFHSPSGPYSAAHTAAMQQQQQPQQSTPVRSTPNGPLNVMMDRRLEQPPTPGAAGSAGAAPAQHAADASAHSSGGHGHVGSVPSGGSNGSSSGNPHALSTPNTSNHGAGAPSSHPQQRRIPEKRPSEHGTPFGDVSSSSRHDEFERSTSVVGGGNDTVTSGDAPSAPGESALPHLSRAKTEDAPVSHTSSTASSTLSSHQPLDMVYSSEARSSETDAQKQSHDA